MQNNHISRQRRKLFCKILLFTRCYVKRLLTWQDFFWFASSETLKLNFCIITSNFSARRPPVEETTSFLNSLLASHGPNYLEKIFGSKARDRLRDMGGVNQVAIALSGNKLIKDKLLIFCFCKFSHI